MGIRFRLTVSNPPDPQVLAAAADPQHSMAGIRRLHVLIDIEIRKRDHSRISKKTK
jgi:hypothetical protein